MIYTASPTIPKNTTVAIPYEITLLCDKGIISRVSVFFPWGCAGLVGIRVLRYTWPLFPLTRNEWLIGNDVQWNFACEFELSTDPYSLLIQAYNLDDTFDHTPIIIVEMYRPSLSTRLAWLLKELEGD